MYHLGEKKHGQEEEEEEEEEHVSLHQESVCRTNLALQSRSTLIRREESSGARSEKIKDKSTVGEAEKMLLTAAEM
jgi:hypothetical protein